MTNANYLFARISPVYPQNSLIRGYGFALRCVVGDYAPQSKAITTPTIVLEVDIAKVRSQVTAKSS